MFFQFSLICTVHGSFIVCKICIFFFTEKFMKKDDYVSGRMHNKLII